MLKTFFFSLCKIKKELHLHVPTIPLNLNRTVDFFSVFVLYNVLYGSVLVSILCLVENCIIYNNAKYNIVGAHTDLHVDICIILLSHWTSKYFR